jgi:hypothetical protein
MVCLLSDAVGKSCTRISGHVSRVLDKTGTAEVLMLYKEGSLETHHVLF